ncbi:hypothetical protein Goari_024090, partial [Gossypium aridum]|nr:hypothetical protein [Gossypium aridum]
MGDRNTAFFHKFALERRHINRIKSLKTKVGEITNIDSEMEDIARKYFENTFSTKSVGEVEHILSGVEQQIRGDMNQMLLAWYTANEVFATLKVYSEGLSSLMHLAKEKGLGKEVRGAQTFKRILKEYEEASGQCVNYEKSTTFYISNTTAQMRYLGKRLAFQLLKDRMENKINNWSEIYLHILGRASELPKEFFRMAYAGDWAIWIKRNKWLYEGQRRSGLAVVNSIKKYVCEIDGISSSKLSSKMKTEKQRPVENLDLEGEVLGSKVAINENVPSSFAAEALAYIQSMLLGLDLGFMKDKVEGDTLSIIRKLKRDDEDKYKIGAFIRDGKGLKRRVQFCLQDGVPVFSREEVDRDRRRE